MSLPLVRKLIRFVQQEFGVSDAEIRTVLAREEGTANLPILLWQYGFITVSQLDVLFEWLLGMQMSNQAQASHWRSL